MISSQIPKGEIWILKADSLIIVEEGKSPSKQIKPEITITYTADENLSVISDGGYQYREKSFDPDTIFISDNNPYLTKKVDIILALNDKNLEAFI